MSTNNPAADLLNELHRQKVQADMTRLDQTAFEAQVKVDLQPVSSSAFRGLLFGLPLALVLWGLPMIAWLATGSPWLGAGTCILEFGLAAWIIWAKRSPTQPGSKPHAPTAQVQSDKTDSSVGGAV